MTVTGRIARVAAIGAGVGVGTTLSFQAWKNTSKATDQPVLSVGADAATALAFGGMAHLAGRSSLQFGGSPFLRSGLIAASAAAAAMTVGTAVVVNMEDAKGPLAGCLRPGATQGAR